MNRLYVILGALSILFSLVCARADVLGISPAGQMACCEYARYTLTVTNEMSGPRSFTLTATSDEGIKVLLEPDTVPLPAKGSADLVMMVRPECGLPAGDYVLTVSAEYQGRCTDVCECPYVSDEAEVLLTVPEDCMPAVEPAEQGESDTIKIEIGNTSAGAETDTERIPAGAMTAGRTDNYTAIGALMVLLGVFIILLALIRRDKR